MLLLKNKISLALFLIVKKVFFKKQKRKKLNSFEKNKCEEKNAKAKNLIY